MSVRQELYEGADIVAHKIGGDVLGKWGEGLADVLQRISDHKGKHLIVVSALKGVTDSLQKYVKNRDRHFADNFLLQAYGAAANREGLSDFLDASPYYHNLNLESMSEAEILGIGEVLSTQLVYSFFKRKGLNSSKVDFFGVEYNSNSRREFVKPNPDFPIRAQQHRIDAQPDLEASRGKMKVVRELLDKHDVVVAPGFVARYRDGSAVTLGRGGSDTSLFVYAYGLGLKQGILWKSVPGIRSADPEIVTNNKLVKYVTPLQGLNLTLFGGNVVNYNAMKIANDNGIKVKIPFIKNPEIFSEISSDAENKILKSKESSAKFVGGTKDSVLLHFDYDEVSKRVNRLVERNLGDFIHIFGPVLNPTVVITDAKKYYEISAEEGWKEDNGMPVATVGIIGEGLAEMKGALSRASGAIFDADRGIYGSVAATRKGTKGGYMAFFINQSDMEDIIRIEHKLFIENSA